MTAKRSPIGAALFLRVQFTCSTDADGLHLHVSAHEGSYQAWWKDIRAEFNGWGNKKSEVHINGKAVSKTAITSLANGISVTFVDDGNGEDLQLR